MIGAEIPAWSRLRRSVHTPVTTYAPGGGRILRCSAAPYIPPSPQQNSAVMSRSGPAPRSEEHTSELQSLMRISYAVFCLKKKSYNIIHVKNIQKVKRVINTQM